MPPSRGRAWVVVLGDFGRSPRMQNHTVSLSKQAGLHVDVIAFAGSKPIPAVANNQRITLHVIPEPWRILSRLPRSLGLVLKALMQALWLLAMLLLWMPSPDVILLQVPPAIPTLAMCWLASVRHGALFIIDWHNFAYTLMRLSMSRRHPLVQLAEAFERFWGRFGDRHLCVSNAMKDELQKHWNIKATVFYDRPPAQFEPTPLAQKHELLQRLAPVLDEPMHPFDCCASSARRPASGFSKPLPISRRASAASHEDLHCLINQLDGHTVVKPSAASAGYSSSMCTVQSKTAGGVYLREDRPALVVSSTSWTPDEDFQVLLDAAMLYDEQAQQRPEVLPRILFLVTGKGPQREAYRRRMKSLDLRRVAFRLLWLEAADYPLLLGSCDLGVSLHMSSSGVDLPMKVVDMYGCGLPVCAAAYQCISELVSHGHNGLLFTCADELSRHLLDVLEGFPERPSELLRGLQHNVAATNALSWDASWESIVKPLVLGRSKASK